MDVNQLHSLFVDAAETDGGCHQLFASKRWPLGRM
jgi:hypothetical protein